VGTDAFATSLWQLAPARTQIHGVSLGQRPIDLSSEARGEGACLAKLAEADRYRLHSDMLTDVPRIGLDARGSGSFAAPYPVHTRPETP